MENFNLILPEIFLSLSIFITLLIGVFFKNSYNLTINITYIIIVCLLLIIFNSFKESGDLFFNSFVSNSFTNFFKILILLGTLFVILISNNFIKEMKINYFEYPLLILFSVFSSSELVASSIISIFFFVHATLFIITFFN